MNNRSARFMLGEASGSQFVDFRSNLSIFWNAGPPVNLSRPTGGVTPVPPAPARLRETLALAAHRLVIQPTVEQILIWQKGHFENQFVLVGCFKFSLMAKHYMTTSNLTTTKILSVHPVFWPDKVLCGCFGRNTLFGMRLWELFSCNG
jgi:hypothetical protein